MTKPADNDPGNARWADFCGRLGVAPGSVYYGLCLRYRETHRLYHTLEHISHCFAEFEALSAPCLDADAVELAIWFHDVVYDTHAHDNEEQSADYLRAAALEIGLERGLTDRAAALILATKHVVLPVEIDTRVMVDVDLAILGQTWEQFARYEEQIRAEYAWVTPKAFSAGRKAVLLTFLERERIYSTPALRDKYERQARLNINRSIVQLDTPAL